MGLDNMYEYDEKLKQYRRKYRDADPASHMQESTSSSSIYETPAGEEMRKERKKNRHHGGPTKVFWKFLFWVVFLLGLSVWIFFLVLSFKSPEEAIYSPAVRREEPVLPEIP